MAHQCTACGRTFEDGSTAMLSGCPDCGGNTFQYFKGEPPETTGTPPEPEIDAGVSGTVGETVGKARAAMTGLMGDDPTPRSDASPSSDGDDDILVADETPIPPDGTDDPTTDTTDATTDTPSDVETAPSPADASAESNAGATAEKTATEEGTATVSDTPDDPEDRPDLEELRAELNDQFESIKILEPGQYELNLMELYEREEQIIALQEDGRYVIDVPGTGQFTGE
jgi:predicted  nucleic acid-binding Zn-ribbon protein